jgi:FkbM family methyltransferase
MAYTSPDVLNYIDKTRVQTIVDAGACDGTTSVLLAKVYSNAHVYAFECNPRILEKCESTIQSSGVSERITLTKTGLGNVPSTERFFPYVKGNDGASSFFYRIDGVNTQQTIENIQIDTLENQLRLLSAPVPDLLCMDVQGYELNILKGLGNKLRQVKYVIAEVPRETPNRSFLRSGHSCYIGAPTRADILKYLEEYGFKQTGVFYENELEDNILFINRSNATSTGNTLEQ